MSSRADAVLNMQITLIPILAKSWKLSLEQLRDLFKEYDVMHKGAWDNMTDEDWETPGFE